MENRMIRTEGGGYIKNDVLAKIDAYSALLISLEELKISDAAVNAELEKIRSMPLRKAGGFLCFKGAGFSVIDTDEYIAELERQIRDKIML